MTQTSRRTFIASGTAVAAGAVAAGLPLLPAEAATSTYFRHGVASGDPLPGSVILWTRVTPTSSAAPGSGKGAKAAVVWQVATDATFRRIVRHGTFTTSAARDHTVKIDVTGLTAATTYFYRFSYKGRFSPVGRTRTAPAVGADVQRMRLGIVSCANLQAGWFSSYRHLAARDDLDAILHLGDYLYEYGPGEFGYGNKNVDIRPHVPAHETVTLRDYRQRHAQYKQDKDLAALHARHPFINTWDDHETANDTWTEGAENHDETEGDFPVRRAASLKAYDEWMPIRLGGTADLGDATTIFRKFRFGRLIELSLLDLRSYRNAPGEEFSLEIGVTGDPRRVIAGDAQLGWLKNNLSTSPATWNLVGNPVMITPVLVPPLPNLVSDAIGGFAGILPTEGVPYNTDQWDGYAVERKKLTDHIRDNRIKNVVFLTGDIHSGWACDIPVDKGLYPLGGSIATELVTSSVTSNNLDDIVGAPSRSASIVVETAFQVLNRYIKYVNLDDHGYSVLDVTPARVQIDYFVISDRADPRATSARTRSYVVASGTQRVEPSATGIV
ncbi:alkaline phosphatase [Aeromicrobium sp. A1-2]|uniref:alkaline phosphatase D family protein n=1 Tax=Aeromicrobium sp. A1-2 TaxID=2107713 RepID=UPI000E4B9105|nr:alkaline phosphatase D family protein [Aeromicrobium sp. A1-2]AXT85162.1 alkaline phosphatase [Aeromicrobium sp. A1-2]